MGIKTELVTVFHCERCHYDWTSKKHTKEDPPRCCARCKDSYWEMKPRKNKSANRYNMVVELLNHSNKKSYRNMVKSLK